MENCRVVLSPYDAVARIESLVAYFCQEVIDRARTYVVEVAADEDCLALASGLYDRLSFSGCVSTVWACAFVEEPLEAESLKAESLVAESLEAKSLEAKSLEAKSLKLEPYRRLRKTAEESAASLGLTLDWNLPQQKESSDAHCKRVQEAFQRLSPEAKIIIVPIETMVVLCQMMKYEGEVIAFVPQREIPKRYTVSKYKDFCVRQGLAAFRDESSVDIHCWHLLQRDEHPALEVGVVDGELQVKVKEGAREEDITKDAEKLLTFVDAEMQRESIELGRRKAYHQTVLKDLRRCWLALTSQLRALVPVKSSGSSEEISEQIARIEKQRTEDRLRLREMPSMDDYERLSGELENMRLALDEENRKWTQRLENVVKENEEITRKMTEVEGRKDKAVTPMVTLNYKSTELTRFHFQTTSTEELAGITLEWYTGTHSHTCRSNITVLRGVSEISVHRHYFQGESYYILRRGGQVVSNPQLIPMDNITLYGATLSPSECEELEKVMSDLGHEYVKPEAIKRAVELLRKPGHWTGYKALVQMCRDTYAVAE